VTEVVEADGEPRHRVPFPQLVRADAPKGVITTGASLLCPSKCRPYFNVVCFTRYVFSLVTLLQICFIQTDDCFVASKMMCYCVGIGHSTMSKLYYAILKVDLQPTYQLPDLIRITLRPYRPFNLFRLWCPRSVYLQPPTLGDALL
jgi:hypothetical protein